MSAIAREKTSGMSRLGAGKCSYFSNSETFFQSFLYVFRPGAGFCPHQRGVRNSEVSARRESTVHRYRTFEDGHLGSSIFFLFFDYG